MQPKIYWIDNLRGIACLMVVMIHTTTWYITNAQSVRIDLVTAYLRQIIAVILYGFK